MSFLQGLPFEYEIEGEGTLDPIVADPLLVK